MITPVMIGLAAAAGGVANAGIQGIGNVATGAFRARQNMKDMYKDSYAKYKAGEFGLTKAETNKAMKDAGQAINAATATQDEEIRRGVAASGVGAPQNMGVIQAQSNAKANALANARTTLQAQSQEKAAQQYAEMQNLQGAVAQAKSPLAEGLGAAAQTGINAGVGAAIANPETTLGGQAQLVSYQNHYKNAKEAGMSDADAKVLAYQLARTEGK
jgi:hypothetical protein